MSLFPVDQDDQQALPQKILQATACSRKSGSVSGWLVSLTLHALLLAVLSRLIEPSLRGVPGHGGSDGGLINAVFLTESRKSSASKGPLDTRLPDATPDQLSEGSRSKTFIKTVSFQTPEPVPELEQADDPPVIAKTSVSDPAAIELPDPELESIPTTPVPRQVRGARKRPASRLSYHDNPANPDDGKDQTGSGEEPRRSATRATSSSRTTGTRFFGASGNGRKIVYVIDCSGSMSDREVFSRARNELLASLDRLSQAALVQVIFYNDQTHALRGGTELVRNTADQRRRIAQFSRGIVPGGGTHHVPALELALELDPDALFWLTDADEPYLSAADLQELRRRNRRSIPIHAIEFGYGPELTADNFLKRAAKSSGGTHCYCDLGATNDGSP